MTINTWPSHEVAIPAEYVALEQKLLALEANQRYQSELLILQGKFRRKPKLRASAKILGIALILHFASEGSRGKYDYSILHIKRVIDEDGEEWESLQHDTDLSVSSISKGLKVWCDPETGIFERMPDAESTTYDHGAVTKSLQLKVRDGIATDTLGLLQAAIAMELPTSPPKHTARAKRCKQHPTDAQKVVTTCCTCGAVLNKTINTKLM